MLYLHVSGERYVKAYLESFLCRYIDFASEIEHQDLHDVYILFSYKLAVTSHYISKEQTLEGDSAKSK